MQELKAKQKFRIGEILLDYGLITQDQLTRALDKQIADGGRLGSILKGMGYVDNDTLLSVLGKQYDLPSVNLFDVKVPSEILRLLPFDQVKAFKVLPFKADRDAVSLAMVDPRDKEVVQNVEFTMARTVKPYIVPNYQMDKAISRFEKTDYGITVFDGETLREEKVVSDSKMPNIYTLLKLLLDFKASNLHLTAGAPPGMRINNEIKRLSMPVLTTGQMKDMVSELISAEQMEEFERKKELDFVMSISESGRFRINIYKQRSSISLSARIIYEKIPTLEELNLPEWVTEYALKSKGLILVSGLSGHGKTTTIAALVNVINFSRRCNVVTLEDPIEYLHKHGLCNVNQREIGIDTDSFAEGMKHIIRQDPDVIVVGDLKDTESIMIALNAAESGHLVIASINSLNTTTALEKMINIFPESQRPQIRIQLADTLLLGISQALIPLLEDDKKRILSYEKLTNSPRVGNLLREGKVANIRSLMQIASDDMSSLELNLASLCLEGRISFENGLRFAGSPAQYKELFKSGRA
ncbi:MAG: PilT/PilU family type 4a pilus ATPase [Nitrospiraceae bacterium]|nr:MAG: PilT/PilU family type 4a pilus ATPase [Nitrospiraceae bacterium]